MQGLAVVVYISADAYKYIPPSDLSVCTVLLHKYILCKQNVSLTSELKRSSIPLLPNLVSQQFLWRLSAQLVLHPQSAAKLLGHQ